jgi:hypothetical protein
MGTLTPARRPGALAAWLAVAGLAVVLLLLPSSALAHENENLPAKRLIDQAIAIIRTQPDRTDAIADKLHDALDAKDTKGVDLGLVRRADAAFEAKDLHKAQDLLEQAIGAAPHQVVTKPNPKPLAPASTTTTPAAAATPAPVLHEQAQKGGPQAPKGTAGPVLLGLAALFAFVGVVVLRRAH